MSWKELITDPNGTLSHTKIWSNIGMATITITFIVGSYTHGPSSELMLTYGSIVVAGRVSSKYLDAKNTVTDSADERTGHYTRGQYF